MDSDTSVIRIPSVEEEPLFPLQTLQEEEKGPVTVGEEPSSTPVFSVPDQDGPKPPTLPALSPMPDQEKAFLGDSASGSSAVVGKIETLCLGTQGNGISEVGFVSNGGGSTTKRGDLLEAKKKQLLMELERGSLLKEKKTCEGVDGVLDVGGGILGCLKGIGSESVGGSLKIEVIDDTALVIPVGVFKSGNGGGKAKAKAPGGQKKKEKMCENGENDGRKVKPRRQRKRHHEREAEMMGCDMKDSCGGGAGKLGDGATAKVKYARDEMENFWFVNVVEPEVMGWDEKDSCIGGAGKLGDGAEVNYLSGEMGNLRFVNAGELEVTGCDQKDSCIGGAGKLGDGANVKYSRGEMEGLRFVNVVEQRKMWKGVYTGLEASVRKGYDDLASSKHQKQKMNSNFEPRRQHQRPNDHGPGILGEVSSENGDGELRVEEGDVVIANKVDDCWNSNIGGEDAYKGSEGEFIEEEDSDDDYVSIQRPAFHVEGEPDFDSGPPEDGLEYIRRVRWEAAHVPKVKVAKLDRSKVNEVQSFYMPQIPDIPKCPEHLMPLKQWEDAFLDDFSNLRQALSREEEVSITLKPVFTNNGESNSRTEEHSHDPSEDNSSSTHCHQTSRESLNDAMSNYPTFSAIMAMDSVARVSMLKNRIAQAESMNRLSKDDCVWLFALCAAVDTPLHADTCAAIRSLLRKCATLRAEKSEPNDEVVMLNILATIAGRYFGQAGS